MPDGTIYNKKLFLQTINYFNKQQGNMPTKKFWFCNSFAICLLAGEFHPIKFSFSWSRNIKWYFLFPHALCEKNPCSKLFWSVVFCIWTEYGEILRISLYSVRMRGNTDQNNSEYGHFLRRDMLCE